MNEKTSAVELRACSTCKYSAVQRMPPPEIQTVRVCKRFPPAVVGITTPQGVALNTCHPMVPDEFWCYEYAPEGAANG